MELIKTKDMEINNRQTHCLEEENKDHAPLGLSTVLHFIYVLPMSVTYKCSLCQNM